MHTSPIFQPMAKPQTPLSQKSLSKARVYWANVTPGTAGHSDFYSFDTSGKYKVEEGRQLQYGVEGLIRLVDKLGPKVARAIIYDRKEGHEITRKEHGSWA